MTCMFKDSQSLRGLNTPKKRVYFWKPHLLSIVFDFLSQFDNASPDML